MNKLFRFGICAVSALGFILMTAEVRADTSYFRELCERKITFLSDGCYTACILLGVTDKYSDFDSQKKFLKEQGILPERLNNAKKDTLLRKSAAAYMFCKALDIKGGAMMRIFSLSEKYAYRELVYKEIVSEGPENQILNGKELLSILMRASEYKDKAK